MSLTLSQVAPFGITAYHPRSTWEPYGIRRDVDFNRKPPGQFIGDVTKRAIHYTAAINLPDGDPGEILDGIDGIRNLLRNAHWDYLRNRTGGGYTSLVTGEEFPGYPLGYSWGFDWLGGVWEIAGFEYKPAATSGHNDYTKAFLMLTDRADQASAAMLRSARGMARFLKARGAPVEDRPWAHRWFKERTGTGTATACCGDAVIGQINAGLLDISYPEGDVQVDAPIPLPRPRRALDTRPGGYMDTPYDSHNKNLQGRYVQPGVPIKVFIGMASTVEVNCTVIGRGGSGYVEVSGSPNTPTTSLVNFDNNDRLESNTGSILADNGFVYIHAFNSPCDVMLDVRGQFPEA